MSGTPSFLPPVVRGAETGHRGFVAHHRELLEREWDVFLPRIRKQLKRNGRLPQGADSCEDIIADFVGRRGREFRSLLLLAGFFGYGDEAPEGLFATALAVELMHDFVLIHDDIIDGADTRRGGPTVQRRSETVHGLPPGSGAGFPFALIAGDMLYALSIQSFLSVECPAQRKVDALRVFTDAGVETGAGQWAELVFSARGFSDITVDDILDIYRRKTALYSWAAPLSAGALLGGASRDEAQRIKAASLPFGVAFQLIDDVLDIAADRDTFDKPTGLDCVRGVKTLPLKMLHTVCAPGDRRRLEAMAERSRCDDSDRRWLLRACFEHGIIETTLEMADEFQEAGFASVRRAAPSFRAPQSVREIVGECMSRRKRFMIDDRQR